MQRVQAGRSAQPVVLYGLRGVGKTVLLHSFARTARSHAWMVARVEAGIGRTLQAALAETMHTQLVEMARPDAGQRLLRALRTALSF